MLVIENIIVICLSSILLFYSFKLWNELLSKDDDGVLQGLVPVVFVVLVVMPMSVIARFRSQFYSGRIGPENLAQVVDLSVSLLLGVL